MVADVLNIVNWKDVRASVVKLNPELAQIIDDINPKNDHHDFVVVNYPFGVDILTPSNFFLPKNTTEAVAHNHPDIPTSVQKRLNYQNVPVGLLMQKSVECYYQTQNRVIPDKLFRAGDMFGTWELLDNRTAATSVSLAYLSSGARTLFMLPRICDRLLHEKIQQQLAIESAPPSSLRQHRNLFADIARRQFSQHKWQCQILYFSKAWFDHQNSPAWAPFYNYFYRHAWQQSHNTRLQFESNIVWEQILKKIDESNIHLQMQTLSHLKHLYFVAASIFPAMTFATGNESYAAPIRTIQSVYTDIYRLKDYAPIIMHPAHINTKSAVYYSINFPHYLESLVPGPSNLRLVKELHIISQVIEKLQSYNHFDTAIDFNYYHSAKSPQQPIQPIEKIIANDKKLLDYMNRSSLAFPNTSTFFSGCIKISAANQPTAA